MKFIQILNQTWENLVVELQIVFTILSSIITLTLISGLQFIVMIICSIGVMALIPVLFVVNLLALFKRLFRGLVEILVK